MQRNATPGGSLTPHQQRALQALVSQPTIAAAAEACGYNRATLFRYLQDPEFKAAYEQARRASVDEAIACFQKLGTKAAVVLEAALEDPDISLRLRATKQITDVLFRSIEQEDLRRQLEELKEMAQVMREQGYDRRRY